MADSNWIKLNRGIWDNFIWNFDKPKYALAWIDMLLMANYKDKKIIFDGKAETIQRGSFITSMVKLSDRWGMDRGTVKRFLDILQCDGMITYTCNNRRTAISIVNYSIYQSFITDDTTADSTTEPTAEPPADTATHTAQHKNVKKVKESKKVKNDISKPDKHKYGEFNNVLLTDEELEKLKTEYSDWKDRIERLSSYMASTGKSYKSHYATIRNWARKDADNKKPVRKEPVPAWMAKEKQQYDFESLEKELLANGNGPVNNDPDFIREAEELKKMLQEKY